MITTTYYVVGIADEGDEYFEETWVDEKFNTVAEAELYIKHLLESFVMEGWTREDYDIAKVSVTIERGIK